jgi:plastocyanin
MGGLTVPRPYYTRLALAGIAVYIVIEVIILTTTLIIEPSEWEYAVIVGGVALAGGLAIYFWQPWGLVAGLLGGLFGIAFSLDGIGDNLSSPDSFLDFAYRPVIWLGGTILVLTGCAGGLIQHFRRRTSTSGPVIVTRGAMAVLGIVAVLATYSAVLTVAGIDHLSAAEKEGATVLTSRLWKFDLDNIEASSNGSTKIVLDNEDANIHTFTVDALDIDAKVGPLSEKLITLDTPPAGAYEFRCRIAGHEDMRGTLTVR